MKIRVFISYSRKDEVFLHECVRELTTRLGDIALVRWDRSLGIAEETRETGSLSPTITRWITDSDVVVAIVSLYSVTPNRYPLLEWELAQSLRKPLFPVFVDPPESIDVPAPLTIQTKGAGSKPIGEAHMSVLQPPAGPQLRVGGEVGLTRMVDRGHAWEALAGWIRQVAVGDSSEGSAHEDALVQNTISSFGKIVIVVDDDRLAAQRLARQMYGISSLPDWWLAFYNLDSGSKALVALEALQLARCRHSAIVVLDRVIPLSANSEAVDWHSMIEPNEVCVTMRKLVERWVPSNLDPDHIMLLPVSRTLPRKQSIWSRKSRGLLYSKFGVEAQANAAKKAGFFRYGPNDDTWSACIEKWHDVIFGWGPGIRVLVHGGMEDLEEMLYPENLPATEDETGPIFAKAKAQASSAWISTPFSWLAARLRCDGYVALGWDRAFEHDLFDAGCSDRVFRVDSDIPADLRTLRATLFPRDFRDLVSRFGEWKKRIAQGQPEISVICLDTKLVDTRLRHLLEQVCSGGHFQLANLLWVSRDATPGQLKGLIWEDFVPEIHCQSGISFLYDVLALRAEKKANRDG